MARTSFVDVPAPDTYLERFDDCGMRLWKFDRGPTFCGSFFFFSAFLPGTKSPEKFGRNVSISGRKEFLVTYCASILFFFVSLHGTMIPIAQRFPFFFLSMILLDIF